MFKAGIPTLDEIKIKKAIGIIKSLDLRTTTIEEIELLKKVLSQPTTLYIFVG
jgi:hypothetical protein